MADYGKRLLAPASKLLLAGASKSLLKIFKALKLLNFKPNIEVCGNYLLFK